MALLRKGIRHKPPRKLLPLRGRQRGQTSKHPACNACPQIGHACLLERLMLTTTLRIIVTYWQPACFLETFCSMASRQWCAPTQLVRDRLARQRGAYTQVRCSTS
jgi:hypothetical protein